MIDICLKSSAGTSLHFAAEVADTFLKRFIGLMGRRTLLPGTGLILYPCSSIHMMFMRFPIDVLFFDKSMNIIKTGHRLKPWTGFSIAPRAYGVIELPAGSLEALRNQDRNWTLIMHLPL
ncbi:MAG: DUF192 domain-containing protein [Anaerovibrio sp.]|uniref:DUF192 domain-containing protein n=1 Tax=Anaerovibrio sp. TaxID=1872532 RepID=UPI0025D0A0D1|nr:DUF192 domain-containing protein [Anaerovibrio sp.]MCR5177126.1 DUF192 domain-containing protein [Anaerovibrio sp.]